MLFLPRLYWKEHVIDTQHKNLTDANFYFLFYKLVTVYKIGEVHFRLFGTNGFHTKVKSERFTSVGSRCRQNLK